jgi:hypothetical protein
MKPQSSPDPLYGVFATLPPLPAVVRYYDDFSDSYGEVTDPVNSDQWTLRFDGSDATLDYEKFDVNVRGIVKTWCAISLGTLAPNTVEAYFYGAHSIPPDQLTTLLISRPEAMRSLWKALHSGNLPYPAFSALKSLLGFMCRLRIGTWGPEWLDLVAQLPLPKVDKYASVRVGDVFLTVEEEATIVRHIDQVCMRIKTAPTAISHDLLEATAMLVCSYQFGFRRKQIAMLEMRNVRIWNDGLDGHPAVHLTFTMIKQRSEKRVFPMVRRVKREWSPIFIELFQRAEHKGRAGTEHVFECTPDTCGEVIAETLEFVLRHRRTTAELRHTAAQRLVDAGASEEELAAFMGHTDLNTGLIYFRSSPSQGERVNQALGVSAVYQRVVKIAHDRFISAKELIELKGDQQIAGVPHGIPIAGIGGCTLGQPSCPYNPIMSCYGCPKFMPVADAGVHKSVLVELRGVMKFFYASSRGERGSPAFQLKETISTVQAVLSELGSESNELLP